MFPKGGGLAIMAKFVSAPKDGTKGGTSMLR